MGSSRQARACEARERPSENVATRGDKEEKPRRLLHLNLSLISVGIEERPMACRGGFRPRRYVVPGAVPAWVASGRWGPRRARVEQCVTLRAELAYHRWLCDGVPMGPGTHGSCTWQPHIPGPTWTIEFEVIPNAVWRHGRLFLRCRSCASRVTRLYAPAEGAEPRCRRCWGLAHESQSWSYKATGFLRFLGPVAYATTLERRRQRKRSSRARYAERRAILDSKPPNAADV